MPRVFTKSEGLVARIGEFGTATNETPAVVPEAVAIECEGDERLRVERDEEPPAKKKTRKGEEA
jgi:hypothetical protein